jgi:hypothetical protein
MKQVKALYLFLLCAVAMALHIDAVAKKSANILAQQTNVKSVNANNDALMTIVENSKSLVGQIQDGNRGVAEKNQALKNIAQAEKGLFAGIKDVLQPHISVIKKEVEAFFKHIKKPLVKYDDRKAVAALSDLALDVEKLVKTSADDVIATAQKDIEDTAIVTEQIKTEATRVINQVSEQLASGEITPVHAAKEIAAQNKVISLAEKRLKDLVKLTAMAVKESDAQATYLSQFLAPFQAGYFSTQEEKDFAREMIDAKEQEKKELDALRVQIVVNANLAEDKKAEFEVYYVSTMAALNDEIKQQKIITGDEWSNNRKAFWGTVGLIGAAGTAWLAGQYFTAPIESVVDLEGDRMLDAAITQQRDLETDAIIAVQQAEQARLAEEKEEQKLDVAIVQQRALETDAIIAAQQAEQARLAAEQEEQELDAAIAQQSNLETDAIIAAQQAEQEKLVAEKEEQELDAAIAQQSDLGTGAIIAAQAGIE